jgi:hypothetical protein
MTQQAPLAVQGDDAALLQNIGGQFEQSTKAAKRTETSDMTAEPQHSPTTEEHRVRILDELTPNGAASACLDDGQQTSGTETAHDDTGVCNGDHADASALDLHTRVIGSSPVHRSGETQSRPWHEVNLVPGSVDKMSGESSTESEYDNWSIAKCKGSTSQASSQGDGGLNGST